MELKISTWLMILVLLGASTLTAALWYGDINYYYPSANINTTWNNSFDEIQNIQNMSENLRLKMEAGETARFQTLATGSAVVTGTFDAIMMGLTSLRMIDDLFADFSANLGVPLPAWFFSLLLIGIVIALCLTIISAWLNRSQ